MKPTRKTTAATTAAAFSIVLAWIVGLAGVDMPAEVATAVGTLLVGVVTYFTPESSRVTG